MVSLVKAPISKEICLMGGLGNQLFQFAFGRFISRYGVDNLVFDVSHPSARRNREETPYICAVMGLDKFDLRNRKFNQISTKFRNLAIRSTTNDSIRAKVVRGITKPIVQFSLSTSSGSSESHLALALANDLGYIDKDPSTFMRSTYFIGYFQTGRYFSKIVAEDVETREIWRRFVTNSYDKWIGLEPEKSAILHFRRGDYKNSKFGLLSSTYYRSALRKAEQNREISRIYAISDESSKELMLEIKKISNRIDFIETSELTPDAVLGLISQFGVVIGANSSLSWWASALGGLHQDNLAIFPKQWFQKFATPRDLLLPHWITVDGDIWKGDNS